MATDLTDFIAGLPKVELHVHHVGSATPYTVARLAERHAGTTAVPADPALLAEYFTFTDFAHFVEVYLSVVDLIRDAEDLATLTYDIGADLAAQSVRYAELTLTPYSSIVRGVPAEAYCEAVEDARLRAARDHGIQLRWCFDIPGEPTMTGADVTLEVALKQRPDGLVSFGLGGPESGIPRARYAGHFAAARDPDLMAHLREHDIALEVCPTSNACTRSVPSLAEHPLPQLVAAGVPVTVNSDDPPMFSTTLNREYQVAADLLDLDEHGVAELARQAVRYSFLDAAGKTAVLAEIDDYLQALPGEAGRPCARPTD
ncbi:aminodeoxyfutalosine deaminase [Micromonospora haikouensis]|uniref:Aminodeoxyfutalosine deaminase n=1 Tax=Micromonospora haikouensis TaxID=686309 RepID=A0A1C4XVK0_9ACTN|nr:adenosine deaminase family protein [Micromonospora haikouensis]SCF12121.1 aminodeoxyfutalosine deaminase [Micromonospora haikouensis]